MDSEKQFDLGSWTRLQKAFAAGALEIDGETLALIPENAAKIRAAIQSLRHQVRRRLLSP